MLRGRGLLIAVLLAELTLGGAVLAARPAAPPPPHQGNAVALSDGRTVSLIGLGGPATDALLARVRAALPAAVDAVDRFWGSDVSREIEVVAAGSESEFVRLARLDPDRQWSDIAAVSVADSVDLTARRATGQRIVLAPGASAMSDPALRIVLAHELFHLAARADTALDAPRWLTEGVADFVARPTGPLPPGAATNTALPSDAELDVAGPQRAAGYDRAWWFARFVADDYGAEGLRRLYRQACGPGHPDFATAVRQSLGTDLDELRARWARWLSG